jgi:hypothetical protein
MVVARQLIHGSGLGGAEQDYRPGRPRHQISRSSTAAALAARDSGDEIAGDIQVTVAGRPSVGRDGREPPLPGRLSGSKEAKL